MFAVNNVLEKQLNILRVHYHLIPDRQIRKGATLCLTPHAPNIFLEEVAETGGISAGTFTSDADAEQ